VATGLNTELSEGLMVLLMEVCYFICHELWRFMLIASQSIDHESWHMLPDVRQKARKFLIKMSIASGVLPEKLQIRGVTRVLPMTRGTSAELWRGKYKDKLVVVKCLEFLGDARNRLKYHRVGRTSKSPLRSLIIYWFIRS
jgi:hypothetical protein